MCNVVAWNSYQHLLVGLELDSISDCYLAAPEVCRSMIPILIPIWRPSVATIKGLMRPQNPALVLGSPIQVSGIKVHRGLFTCSQQQRSRRAAAVRDVADELLLALEADSSAVKLPLTATQFPQGFSGYFGSASNARSVPNSTGYSHDIDQQGALNAKQHAAVQPQQQEDSAARGVQLLTYAIQRKVTELTKASVQGDVQAWLGAELSAASHWLVVQALLSRADSNADPTQLQHAASYQELEVTLWEQALITLARLGPSPELWSCPGLGPQQWDELGRQLTQSLSTHCPTPPAQSGSTHQGRTGALLAAAQGSPSSAVQVVQSMAQLGGTFVCRPYISQVVVLMCTQPEGPSAWGPAPLTALLSACASVQHLIRHSARRQCALACMDLLPSMSAPQVAASLGALGHYQQAGFTRQHLEQQMEQEDSTNGNLVTTATELPAGSRTADTTQVSESRGLGHLSYAQLAVERLQALGFQGLSMAQAGAALQGLAAVKYWPGEEWVGRLCESVVSSKPQAGSIASSKEEGLVSGISRTHGALELLHGLAALGCSPPRPVLQEVLDRLQAALVAPGGVPGSAAPLPAPAVVSAVKSLVKLQVPVPGSWVSALVQYLGALTPGHDGAAVCAVVGYLPALLLGPSALVVTPEGTLAPASSPSALQQPQQPSPPAPPALGAKQRTFVRSWVQDNISLLEALVEGVGRYLSSAQAKDLHAVITGYAQLRFYPGAQFLQWHQAACLRLGSTFPAPLLLQVRASYSALGFTPEQRVVALMEKAQQRVEKKARQQVRRAGEVVDSIQPGPSARMAHRMPALSNNAGRLRGMSSSSVTADRKQQQMRSRQGSRAEQQQQTVEVDDLAQLLKDV